MSRFSEFTGHPILGRGDLAEALGSGNADIIRAVAEQLGLRYEIQLEEPIRAPIAAAQSPTPIVEVQSDGYPREIQDISLWLLTGRSVLQPLPDTPSGPEYLRWTAQQTFPEEPVGAV